MFTLICAIVLVQITLLSQTQNVLSVYLSWTDTSENESRFRIERRVGEGSFVFLTTVGADSTSYIDVTVHPNTIYTYRLRAENSTGNSSFITSNPVTTSFVTSIQDTTRNISGLRHTFVLFQNYPNPFNPGSEIRFFVPKASHVALRIYNTLGQKIRTLADQKYYTGYYDVHWDGKDSEGNPASSGIYFYELRAGEFSHVQKMTFLK